MVRCKYSVSASLCRWHSDLWFLLSVIHRSITAPSIWCTMSPAGCGLIGCNWTLRKQVLWCTSKQRQQLLLSDPISIGPDYVTPSSSVRDHGIYLDLDRCHPDHVQMLWRAPSIADNQTICANWYLPRTRGVSLVPSRHSSRPTSLPAQSVAGNNERWSSSDIQRQQTRAHYTALTSAPLASWIWDRITFKLATLMFQCVNGTAFCYLSSDVRIVAENTYVRQHHLCYPTLFCRTLSSSRPPLSGTSFSKTSDPPHRYLSLDAGWKLICLITLIIADYVKWSKFLETLSIRFERLWLLIEPVIRRR